MERNISKDMPLQRRKKYEMALERAQKYVDICRAILYEGKTEVKASCDVGLTPGMFRRFCKGLCKGRQEEDSIKVKPEAWEDRREVFLKHLTGEDVVAPDDFDEILQDICEKHLTDKQSQIVTLWMQGQNLSEIANQLGITKQGVDVLKSKADAVLRRPENRLMLQYGRDYLRDVMLYQSLQHALDVECIKDRENRVKQIEEKKQQLKEKIRQMQECQDFSDVPYRQIAALDKEINSLSSDLKRLKNSRHFTEVEQQMMITPFAELDVPSRVYNAFFHAFHWADEKETIPTVYDVASLTVDEMLKIRNLGPGSIKALRDAVKDRFGYDVESHKGGR